MKSQATIERGLIYAVTLTLAVVIISVLYFFFSGANLNGSFSVTSIRINHLTSNALNFSVILNKKISNPLSLKFYINNLNNYFSVAGMQMNITLMPNGEYQYIFNGAINSSTYNLLSNTSNKFVLASYKNTFGKQIFSEISYPISSITTAQANVNQITFYIFPQTTDFGISINGYQTLIENGQTEDLGNGQYTITAVQTNPNSDYFFDDWESGTYSGYISISNPNDSTAILNVRNANGYVILFLGQYGPINFTSNENNLINAQNLYQCGAPRSRFCIDNSVRNLYYIFQENKSAFSFAYPPYFPTSNPYERLGFVGYYKSLYSCSLPSQSNVQTDQGISAFCTVNATYKPEYYITAKSSNASYGLVAIQFFNGTTTPYGAEESGWAEVNSTNIFYAKPTPYNLTSMKGYQFVSWNGTYNSTENPFYVTIKTITNETATFKQCQLYSLTVSSSNLSMGSVKPNGTSYYCAGSTVELQAFPNSGYEFTGWNGTYSSSDNPYFIVINSNTVETGDFEVKPPPPPPPPPPPQGTYYIYGCVVNTASKCIASMNGTTYNIAVGNYNTSTSSSTNVEEMEFPYPAGGKSNSTEVYFNVATKLADSNSDTYTLQGIAGVGTCGAVNVPCNGTYTPYFQWFGGSSRIAYYSCTGTGCPTGSGSGGGGSVPSTYTYKLIYYSVTNSTGQLISGSSNISQSPGVYSASYINSNHPSLYPSVGSNLAFDEFYPYSSSNRYEYQFVNDSQKVVYEYENPMTLKPAYAFCWFNATTNSTFIPHDSVNVSQIINGTLCSKTSSTYSLSVQNDSVNAIYKLVPKTSVPIVIETIPSDSKEILVMELKPSTPKLNYTCRSYINSTVNKTVCLVKYPANMTNFTITFQPKNFPNSNKVNYYYLSEGASGTWMNVSNTNDPSFNIMTNGSAIFYVSFPVPINITTDFLGKPTSFGSYFGWSTVPYETNLIGFNKNDTNASQTVYGFAPPPLDFPPVNPPYPEESLFYYINEGFWSNGNFNDTGGIIENNGDAFECFEQTPSLENCLATAGSTSQSINITQTKNHYEFWYYHNGDMYTLEGLYYPFSVYNGQTLPWTDLPLLPASYEANTTKDVNFELTYPTNITLNYGFYIPIFITYNDNYSNSIGQQVGNCNIADSQPYKSVSSYLENMSAGNFWVCSSLAVETPSVIIHSALVTNPDQIFTIMLPNKENTYQATPITTVNYSMKLSPSYLTGFNSTPILSVEGAHTTYQSIDSNEYEVVLLGTPSNNEENAYGFYSTIAT